MLEQVWFSQYQGREIGMYSLLYSPLVFLLIKAFERQIIAHIQIQGQFKVFLHPKLNNCYTFSGPIHLLSCLQDGRKAENPEKPTQGEDLMHDACQ